MMEHRFVRERPRIEPMPAEVRHLSRFHASLPHPEGGWFQGAGDTKEEAYQSLARNTNRAVLYDAFHARLWDEL